MVHSDINIKIIILLFCLSIAAFLSHRLGYMETTTPLPPLYNEIPNKLLNSQNINSQFDNTSQTKIRCERASLEGYGFCGIGIILKGEDIRNGLDLTRFNKISLAISYDAPLDKAKIKISFRNFNQEYSTINDEVSLKFNSISYSPKNHESTVMIPLDALQVDNWWVEQYKIDFEHSQVDLSNIAYFEVLTDGMDSIGKYQIEIKKVVLYGELISEANLLKLILLIWLISIIFIVTAQRNKLKKVSMIDTLTGVFNRQGICNWTNKKISTHSSKRDLCMFYLDLDDFKKINDTFGHKVGDQLLIAFCKVIQDFLQVTPNITYSFARLSGDEFTLVIIGLKEHEIKNFAEILLALLEDPIMLNEHETYAHASLGIAQYNQDIKSFEDLLARADSAMYYAKKDGKNRYKVFNETVSQDIFFRKQTAEKVKNAIIEDNFHLNFMPIFDANSLEMVSVEVLLRTNAETLQGIGPDVFIPIAEEYNLIKDIDYWVIEATFKQIKKEEKFLKGHRLTFCINISAAELHNPHFVSYLNDLLQIYQISPQSIELEVTETSFVETDQKSISTLNEIKELGVGLSLDDFGTGYTAFSQLINYPVGCLKIDKSFIDNLYYTDNTQATMVKAIISIADAYQLKTVGEGIEETRQYKFLLEHGCNMIQGYLFAKPMSWSNLKESINDPKALEARQLKLLD